MCVEGHLDAIHIDRTSIGTRTDQVSIETYVTAYCRLNAGPRKTYRICMPEGMLDLIRISSEGDLRKSSVRLRSGSSRSFVQVAARIAQRSGATRGSPVWD